VRGELEYAVFQLSNGILVVYFLEFNNQSTNVAFISSTPTGLGLMLRHTEKNMPAIEKMLRDIV